MLIQREDGEILNLGAAVRFTPIPTEVAFLAQFPDNRNYIIKDMTIWYYYKMVKLGDVHAMKFEWVDEDRYIGVSAKI